MIPPPKKKCFLNFLSQLIELCEAKQEVQIDPEVEKTEDEEKSEDEDKEQK